MHEADSEGFCIPLTNEKLIKKDYKLPPNSIMNRDLERKIDLIVDFLRKYGIVDEGIFTFIKTMKVYSFFLFNNSLFFFSII